MPQRRAGLYARFSSDRQHERSIDDQLAAARRYVAAAGDVVAREFTDEARSGAHLLSRPGVMALIAAAEAGEIDVVIAEALDRLSRDQADTATLYKSLAFRGVAIETLSEGAVNEMHVGLRGTMNALFLKDLAHKIRRGQRGQVERGYSAGGLAYGYRVRRELDAKGEPVRGLREPDPDQAPIVRRIFAEYVAGASGRAIAKRLNAEGIPGPRGGPWNASTINGARGRANGILQNPVYAGRLTWNRVRMVRDPGSGKRISRVNPDAERVVKVDESLRLVDDATWEAAQALKARRAEYPAHVNRRPKQLLSGLLRCGECGSSFVSIGAGRIGCARRKETGTCGNNRTMTMIDVERRVLAGLKERLVAPDALAAALAEYRAERDRGRREARANAVRHQRQRTSLKTRIDRIVEAIADGSDTPAMRVKLLEYEADLAALSSPQDKGAAEVVELHPSFPEIYRRKVEGLESLAAGDSIMRGEASQLLRSLITALTIHARPGRGQYEIELEGSLAGVLALVEGRDTSREVRVTVVAEEGLEPPTQGL